MSRVLLALLSLLAGLAAAHGTRPHIVFILADDLGWNDVGFHGSNAVRTPNIDALAWAGRALQRYYVPPICTPSRAALMTGKYPIHTGMQHDVLFGAEPRGLPLAETLLPRHLQRLGYRTHLVGKWHLGSYKREYLPLSRGFDSHVGFWTGKIDLYDHTTVERGSWGYDFRRDFRLADDLFGKYATDIYTEEAVRVISSHNASAPLFLLVAHSAMHSGNPYEPLRAPEHVIQTFAHIQDPQRRKFAAMLWKLDESVGKVVEALDKSGLLQNSVIVFSTDNGGPAAGFNENAASNYPLRGVKNTLWEGGVRGAGCVWSPALRARGGAAGPAGRLVHITDWLPTLYTAAGGHISALGAIDGVSQWEALSGGAGGGRGGCPARSAVVHNIDDIWGSASIAVGDWKIIKGTNYNGQWDQWYGPGEREGAYDAQLVLRSDVARAVRPLTPLPSAPQIHSIRAAMSVQCTAARPPVPVPAAVPCEPLRAPCLFNTAADPCELRNMAALEPKILEAMLEELARVNRTAVPPGNLPLDPHGDPRYWGRVYTNFGDYETTPPRADCV